jgi:hypothetical protein
LSTPGTAGTGSGGGGAAFTQGGSPGGTGVFILGIPTAQVYGASIPVQFGSIAINSSNNLQISANSNVVISPGVGLSGLFIPNLASVTSATRSGFYRLLYNPTTGQFVYDTDLSP